MLILGDSVPWSLRNDHPRPLVIDGFGPVDVQNSAVPNCPVLRAGEPFVDGLYPLTADPAGCMADDRFSETVDDYDPDLIFMLFAWSGFGGGRELDDGTKLRPCDPAFDTAWAAEYETLVRRFSGSARVIVATVAPRALPGQPGADKAACLNNALRQRDVLLFDYAEWICPGGDCEPYAALRPDGTHFARTRSVRTSAIESLLAGVLATSGLATGNVG